MRLIHFALALAALGLGTSLRAQDAARTKSAPIRRGQPSDPLPLKYTGPRTVAAITRGDLMTRLYKFADDSMMGRLAGTPWNDKGTDYIAAEVRRLGLAPGGDSGTYFQHPLITREVAATSTLGVAGTSYELWKDFAPRDQGPGSRSFDGVTTVYGGVFGDTSTYLSAADAEGKVVVVRTGSDSTGAPDVNVINRFLLTQRYASAAAIAVIFLDWAPPGYVDESFRRPQVDEKREEAANPAQVPSYFYITRAIARDLFGSNPDSLRTGMTGRAVSGATHIETKQAPGRNVIAILPGSDPALRGQYVVIGAHNDHIGFNHRPVDHDSVKAFLRVAAPQGADNAAPNPGPEDWARINAVKDSLRRLYAERPDSIYNGADDDGSGSMTVLEIAEAFAGNRARPRRSIMFVWHVGEELGLLGSEYFTDHPTVARDSMVAELNIDMVGRGHRRDVTGSTKGGAMLHGGPS